MQFQHFLIYVVFVTRKKVCHMKSTYQASLEFLIRGSESSSSLLATDYSAMGYIVFPFTLSCSVMVDLVVVALPVCMIQLHWHFSRLIHWFLVGREFLRCWRRVVVKIFLTHKHQTTQESSAINQSMSAGQQFGLKFCMAKCEPITDSHIIIKYQA